MSDTVYSSDGENYLRDIEDVLVDFDIGVECILYEGTSVEFVHASFINADAFVERMQDSARDTVGEYAEDYLRGIDRDKIQSLKKHIAEWFNTHVEQPAFFGVKDPIEKRIIVDNNGDHRELGPDE